MKIELVITKILQPIKSAFVQLETSLKHVKEKKQKKKNQSVKQASTHCNKVRLMKHYDYH